MSFDMLMPVFDTAMNFASLQQSAALARRQGASAEMDALASRQKAAFDEARSRERARSLAGRQLARFGRAGVTPEGSPIEVASDDAATAELDALAIRQGGDLRAARLMDEAALKRHQAAVEGRLAAYELGTRGYGIVGKNGPRLLAG